MDLGTSSTQLIATAFTFGLSALAFAYFPFIFALTNGIIKANSGHNAHSSSIISVFVFAFVIHFLSCIFFMMGVKLLDVLSALYEDKYFQSKVFSVFWARGESEVFSLAKASGGVEDKGAYLQLYIIQTLADWLELIGIWIVFIVACSYAMVQTKKDQMQFNVVNFLVWVLISNVIGYFIYFTWAKIANLALFIPNNTLLERIFESYKNLVIGG